jgi:hypothetical protein
MKIKKQKSLIENETFLPFWLIGTAIFSIIIHNLFYAFTGKEEVTFFLLSLILAASFYNSVLYNILTYLSKEKPKDIWKLGWLGILGILTIFAPFMVTFYVFFAFFGLKNSK